MRDRAVRQRVASSALVAALLSVTFWLNLLYFVFNLLPLPPLDGCCLPLLFLSPSAADKYQSFVWNPSMRLFGLIVGYWLGTDRVAAAAAGGAATATKVTLSRAATSALDATR